MFCDASDALFSCQQVTTRAAVIAKSLTERAVCSCLGCCPHRSVWSEGDKCCWCLRIDCRRLRSSALFLAALLSTGRTEEKADTGCQLSLGSQACLWRRFSIARWRSLSMDLVSTILLKLWGNQMVQVALFWFVRCLFLSIGDYPRYPLSSWFSFTRLGYKHTHARTPPHMWVMSHSILEIIKSTKARHFLLSPASPSINALILVYFSYTSFSLNYGWLSHCDTSPAVFHPCSHRASRESLFYLLSATSFWPGRSGRDFDFCPLTKSKCCLRPHFLNSFRL